MDGFFLVGGNIDESVIAECIQRFGSHSCDREGRRSGNGFGDFQSVASVYGRTDGRIPVVSPTRNVLTIRIAEVPDECNFRDKAVVRAPRAAFNIAYFLLLRHRGFSLKSQVRSD